MAKPIKPSQSALEKFEEQFAASFGEGTLTTGLDVRPYDVISTGSLTLDVATGVGGYVEGRLHQVHGPQDIGKTMLACLAVAEAQRKYPFKRVAYIDMENKIDLNRADALGIDRSRWYLYKPTNAEEVADAMGRFCNQNFISMVIVDSIGAMIGKVEQDKQADEKTVAVVAQIVTRMVKNATSLASKNGQAVIMINQNRANISPYGGSIVLPGGWALKYSTTLDFKLSGTSKQPLEDTIDGEKIPVAKEVAIHVERNKVGPKGRTAMVLFNTMPSKYGPVGVDRADECAAVGVKLGIIPQGGAWYTEPVSGERFQGRDALVDFLRGHPETIEEIRHRCLAKGSGDIIANTESDDGEVITIQPEQPEVEVRAGRAPRRPKSV